MKTNIFTLSSKPGIKRDGTNLDNEFYQDGEWVRFQRGRPRKIGGYRAMSTLLTGPFRGVYVDSRATLNTAHVFSPWGVQQLAFDILGSGSGVIDRTPAGLPYNANYNWVSDAMFDGTGGGTTALVCASTPDLDSIASDATGGVYSGDVTTGAALTAVSDGAGPILVSGGCVVLQPFLFVYGSNGLIRNSNANNFVGAGGWAGTNANAANVSGTKVVLGLPVRGGSNSPAGMFWALDSLIRVSYVGGTALWKYDPVSTNTTMMSKKGVVEYDGVFYWPGVDRFYFYNGVVQELPNQMSANYFFDNLNFVQSQKVWGLKIPRFGEIWWFYPSGVNTECNKVLIYNVREGTWYDSPCARSAGYSARVFRFPVMGGGEQTPTILLKYTVVAGVFNTGDVVTGGTSGAVGTVIRTLPGQLSISVPSSGAFVNGEAISNGGSTATGTLTADPLSQVLGTFWQHEYGKDKVLGSSVSAILSFFETSNFGWNTGGPAQDSPQGANASTRMTRFEPDFISEGPLSVEIRGQKYAQSGTQTGTLFPFDASTEFISMREQRRTLSLRVTSNAVGGAYQGGRSLMSLEPGDERP